MSDSDDDLLELAGIGSDEESDYGPQVSKTKRGTSKKRNISNSDYEDNDDEDEDEDMGELKPEEDPYPLEGKYKDEEDKMKLMQMDEVSREGILYDRIQEKERFRERRFLALRARQSKVESKSIKTGSSSKKLRTSKLSELKRQRERKSNKDSRKTRAQDDYMDEEEDYDDDEDLRELAGYGEEDEEDYYSDEYESSRKSNRSKNDYSAEFQDASLEDINNKIRSSRNVLEKFLYRDEFDVCIPGTMVRVNVGPSRTTNQLQYRMALVEEIRRGGKPYKLLGKLCDTYLKVSQGDSTTVVDISCLSNSPVTLEEFEMYKKRISTSADHSLPTVRYVEDKFTELKAMASKRLTDNDINRMIARKEELSIYNMNTATRVRKLGRLREELQVALEQGDEKVSKSLQEQIDNLSKSFQTAKNTSKLEQINIRNQKSNQEFIRKAEKKLVETKRKQLRNNDFSDPFSRLRTNPKVFYKSVEKQDDNIQKIKDKVDEKEEKNKIKNSIFRRDGIDALIKTIDIDFDFQN
jgi:RNA polymerase-associated protein RTF1